MTSVLFDAHQLGRRQTGNETYVRELLDSLRGLEDVSIHAVVERGQGPRGVLAPPVQTHLVPGNGFGRLAAMSLLARRIRPDLLHAIYFLPPMIGRPTVLTIHDISFERYPEFFSRTALIRDRIFVRLSARRATRIVTVSETSRRDLIEIYGIPPERVVAIPNGVSPVFRPLADASPGRDGSQPIRVLAVGTLQPRKNLIRLLAAVRRVSADVPVVLRIVGPDGFQADAIRQRLGGSADVEIVGYVSDEGLADEYRRADMLVYPSIYEGFGLPVIEAMACGTPVVTSTGGSLPEVAGDAAVIVDPFDVSAIAAGIRRLAEDPILATTLRERGIRRAGQFTWAEAARRHLEIYREVA